MALRALWPYPKQTPPPFGLLGGAAERNFDHPNEGKIFTNYSLLITN